ncbi:unnamed protein product [Clonostachys byssicola]|uniref:Molybdopterin synthase sulfur carrier subunit n=1 Tax=Clonostachys byssicola TaxID=160290 RepID=A0A9N9UY67_9HYPO|nr:unnamed protein product [Clonostachys byssicola]
MAARERKYAGLPDMDDAPDIYETPELTDDVSTVPTTTAHTHSDDEFFDVEDDTQPISRSRLRINEARSRFMPASVDANGVDFSDRVDGKRKSYKASSRRQRILQDGTEELGDLSDDDDDESLERRIARLKREVEEAKDEYSRRKATASSTEAGDSGATERLDSLSQVLHQISQPVGVATALRPTQRAPEPAQADDAELSGEQGATYTITYAPSYEQTHALAKAADFDRRLLLLEKGLGISSASIPEANSEGIPRAVLPTLDSLDKQITTLSQATTANLDAISRRVRTLALEQDKLNESREKAKTLREELGKQVSTPGEEDSEQDAKINALYAILPTIENLTPMLPPLLDRLRSLKAIHADAATASETLDRIQKDQADMAAELKQWRSGIEKMESTMGKGDETVKSNMKVMQGWVKDLEERMSKLNYLVHHPITMAAATPDTGVEYFDILYFAGASSITGKEREQLHAPLPLGQLFAQLESKYPGIKTQILDSCLVTINLDYIDVPAETSAEGEGLVIQPGDEVAIIPPVSSG